MAEIHTADENETEDSPRQSDADEPDNKSNEEPPERRRRVMSHMAQCNFRDKVGKIRPLLDFLSNKFIRNTPDCKKVMQKRERESYEVYTEENKGILAVAWRDNNVVYTLYNEHGVQPVQYANWYSSKENKSLQVTAT
ncbi:hypothetical protein PR048_011593, partial [Dryococelus australis]